MRYCIDIGHNTPSDTGAIGLLSEDVLVKEVGLALIDILRKNGHQVFETKAIGSATVTGSLKARVTQSNKFEPDLFVSIHANAFHPTSEAVGTEVFAVSQSGRDIARKVVAQFVSAGFKDRGVKDGKHLYVVQQPVAVSILVELGFIDSVADVALLQKIGSQGLAQLIVNAIVPVESANILSDKTLGQFIDEAGGSTAPLKLLNMKLTGVASELGSGLRILAPESPHYRSNDAATIMAIQPELLSSFYLIAAEYFATTGKKMIVNSCYRTAAQQIILYEWAQRKLCGISLAAYPGTSNHEGGEAVDVEDWETLKPIFTRHQWKSQYDKTGTDPVHFERSCNKPNQTVMALQRYYNRYNLNNLLVPDGGYGEKTRAAALSIPITGY